MNNINVIKMSCKFNINVLLKVVCNEMTAKPQSRLATVNLSKKESYDW